MNHLMTHHGSLITTHGPWFTAVVSGNSSWNSEPPWLLVVHGWKWLAISWTTRDSSWLRMASGYPSPTHGLAAWPNPWLSHLSPGTAAAPVGGDANRPQDPRARAEQGVQRTQDHTDQGTQGAQGAEPPGESRRCKNTCRCKTVLNISMNHILEIYMLWTYLKHTMEMYIYIIMCIIMYLFQFVLLYVSPLQVVCKDM